MESVLPNGQSLHGRIDLLIDVGTSWVLLDHKSNPGGRQRWEQLATDFGGQLTAYSEAVTRATGKNVTETWLVLPVAGGAVRVQSSPVS